MSVYEQMLAAKSSRGAGYLVLVDPDRWGLDEVEDFIRRINGSGADGIMVGSSLILGEGAQRKMRLIQQTATLPVILFPGNVNQLTPHVDAVFYLSVISGRNPQFLIGDQVQAAPVVRELGIEPMATAYMLIESGRVTTAEFVSGSKPIPRDKDEIAIAHALAADYLGFKFIYLEAGSGAQYSVTPRMVKAVSSCTDVPVIVGGGIHTPEEAGALAKAGASFVVTGNILEDPEKSHLMEAFAKAIHN
ncbi:MAG: geranylgeranylglyceryl/heptaprenylglyceryl phosphate synthase [Candidatus Marinimicrobia bacterium]|nr:geranylgeranylglyceryl/heptaprenylglyceryl phosphate synthase [Candidatus Neomarinimicrobiota bacterium]MBT3632554.1 geranylgeranylglyceryl/heptaprenylglyceryl phosphate synthase [Candidatus Neomarinimicrobiota bacterium]MBT3824953.1 geranylgeranylglyceryl/heptaprenylglyceryl phosphate synthase [Candidatus Neomarinimicrobiota bacterium]MBT4131594.1 geranylgeranylglyceryl/heptaprenylglyceryl phosphate synthase [Candidatus Neomarinimicrobiota bacterium]MBT4295256.1 geranylgeranylglyceryl/hepta